MTTVLNPTHPVTQNCPASGQDILKGILNPQSGDRAIESGWFEQPRDMPNPQEKGEGKGRTSSLISSTDWLSEEKGKMCNRY